jgi:hypothetical protein
MLLPASKLRDGRLRLFWEFWLLRAKLRLGFGPARWQCTFLGE